jgi:hypothetical protein
MVPPTARETPRVGEDESWVWPSNHGPSQVQRRKVLDVLGYHCPALSGSHDQQILIGQPNQIRTLLHRDHIKTPNTKPSRNIGSVHLIE